MRITSILFIIFFFLSGCAATDVLNYGLSGDGARQVNNYWADKPTPYLIKHLKARSNYPDSCRSFKYSVDYETILNILKQRINEPGVCDCFREVKKNKIC